MQLTRLFTDAEERLKSTDDKRAAALGGASDGCERIMRT